jgi:phosphoglucosamine mutase
MRKLFGTDGIRGQANRYPITPEVALQLGKVVAHVSGASGHGSKRAVIGKDTRLSGYMLETALTSGLVSMGMDVFLVGPVPTPAVAHLTRSLAATVGIMLTASHNPYDDNGIKIFDHQGYKLPDEIEEQIEENLLTEALTSEHIRSADLGKAYRVEDARGRYIEQAKNAIDNHNLSGLKIVLDCANGASYQAGPWIMQELGAQVIKTHAEPDGYNINTGCGALHPEVVGALVRQHEADVGIAFDGDADRVVFADAEGRVVSGDQILAMCAMDLHDQGKLKEDTLVVTSMSNLGLHEAMRRRGIRVVTTKVGDRYVIEAMRAGGYSFGGEYSGHVIFADYATTGDGIITALQVLKLMKETGKPLAELASCMTAYPSKLISLPVAQKPPLEGLSSLQEALHGFRESLDGKGRTVVRYSGTEPKIRLMVEAADVSMVELWIRRLQSALQHDGVLGTAGD